MVIGAGTKRKVPYEYVPPTQPEHVDSETITLEDIPGPNPIPTTAPDVAVYTPPIENISDLKYFSTSSQAAPREYKDQFVSQDNA